MSLFDDLMKNLDSMKDEGALMEIVKKIAALPMEIKLTNAQVDQLEMEFRPWNSKERQEKLLRLLPIIMPVVPRFKMTKRQYERVLANVLEMSFYQKSAELEAACVAIVPPVFTPGADLALYLYIRAVLKNNKAEMEKYLYEAIAQNINSCSFGEFFERRDDLLQGRMEEIKDAVDRMRPIVVKDKTLEVLNKKKYKDAAAIFSTAEITKYTAPVSTGYNSYSSTQTDVSIALPKEQLDKVTDEITAQFTEAFDKAVQMEIDGHTFVLTYVEK